MLPRNRIDGLIDRYLGRVRFNTFSFGTVLFLGAIGTLSPRLHVIIIDAESLINLGTQSSIIIDPEIS